MIPTKFFMLGEKFDPLVDRYLRMQAALNTFNEKQPDHAFSIFLINEGLVDNEYAEFNRILDSLELEE